MIPLLFFASGIVVGGFLAAAWSMYIFGRGVDYAQAVEFVKRTYGVDTYGNEIDRAELEALLNG